jgi:hypothetical protein
MSKISNNKVQLSIFKLQDEQQNFDTLNKKLNKMLGLDNRPALNEMLETILRTPMSFPESQRMFIKQCILNYMFDKSLTEKQLDYLHALYKKASKNTVTHNTNGGVLTLVKS